MKVPSRTKENDFSKLVSTHFRGQIYCNACEFPLSLGRDFNVFNSNLINHIDSGHHQQVKLNKTFDDFDSYIKLLIEGRAKNGEFKFDWEDNFDFDLLSKYGIEKKEIKKSCAGDASAVDDNQPENVEDSKLIEETKKKKKRKNKNKELNSIVIYCKHCKCNLPQLCTNSDSNIFNVRLHLLSRLHIIETALFYYKNPKANDDDELFEYEDEEIKHVPDFVKNYFPDLDDEEDKEDEDDEGLGLRGIFDQVESDCQFLVYKQPTVFKCSLCNHSINVRHEYDYQTLSKHLNRKKHVKKVLQFCKKNDSMYIAKSQNQHQKRFKDQKNISGKNKLDRDGTNLTGNQNTGKNTDVINLVDVCKSSNNSVMAKTKDLINDSFSCFIPEFFQSNKPYILLKSDGVYCCSICNRCLINNNRSNDLNSLRFSKILLEHFLSSLHEENLSKFKLITGIEVQSDNDNRCMNKEKSILIRMILFELPDDISYFNINNFIEQSTTDSGLVKVTCTVCSISFVLNRNTNLLRDEPLYKHIMSKFHHSESIKCGCNYFELNDSSPGIPLSSRNVDLTYNTFEQDSNQGLDDVECSNNVTNYNGNDIFLKFSLSEELSSENKYIVMNSNKFLCTLCNVEFSLSKQLHSTGKNISDHLNGFQHKKMKNACMSLPDGCSNKNNLSVIIDNLPEHLKFNKIYLIEENGILSCRICEKELKYLKHYIIDHLNSKKHSRKVVEEKSTLIKKDDANCYEGLTKIVNVPSNNCNSELNDKSGIEPVDNE